MNEINIKENFLLYKDTNVSPKFRILFIQNKGIETNFISLNFDFGSGDIKRIINNIGMEYPVGTAHLLEHLVGNHKIKGIPAINNFLSKKYIYWPYTTFYHTGFTLQNFGEINEPLKDIFELIYNINIHELDIEKEKKVLLNEFEYFRQNNNSIFKNIYKHHPIKFELEGTKENLDEIDFNKLNNCYLDNYLNNKKILIIMKNDFSNVNLKEIENMVLKYENQEVENYRCRYREIRNEPIFSLINDETVLIAFTSIEIIDVCDRIFISFIFEDIFNQLRETLDIESNFDFDFEFGRDFSYLFITFSKKKYCSKLIYDIKKLFSEMKNYQVDEFTFMLFQNKIKSRWVRSLDDLIALNINLVDSCFENENYIECMMKGFKYTTKNYKKILNKLQFDVLIENFIKGENFNENEF